MVDLEFDFEVTEEEPQPVVKKRKKNLVCRHWLQNSCMFHDDCEFLHVLDENKLPECKYGINCPTQECRLRHTEMEGSIRDECSRFRAGFCFLGPECPHRHVHRPPSFRPIVSEFLSGNPRVPEAGLGLVAFRAELTEPRRWLQVVESVGIPAKDNPADDSANETMESKGEGKDNEQSGEVPVEDDDDDDDDDEQKEADLGPAPGIEELLTRHSEEGQTMHLPDAQPGKYFLYYIVRANSWDDLKLSVQERKWAAGVSQAVHLNQVLGQCHSVFLFVSILGSQQFQGVAQVEAIATDLRREPCRLPVRWLRHAMLPFTRTRRLTNPGNGGQRLARSGDWQPLPPQLGRALMVLLFDEPEKPIPVDRATTTEFQMVNPNDLRVEDFGPGMDAIPLHRAMVLEKNRLAQGPGGDASTLLDTEETPDAFRWDHLPRLGVDWGRPMLDVATKEIPQVHNFLMAFLETWADRDGYVVECTHSTADHCLSTGRVGIGPPLNQTAPDYIDRGTPLLLLNATDMAVIGIFMAMAPPVRIARFQDGRRVDGHQEEGAEDTHTIMMGCVAECPPVPAADYAPLLPAGSPLTGGPMQRDMMRALGSRIVAPWPPVLLARLFVVLQGLREQEAAARRQEEGAETQREEAPDAAESTERQQRGS